MKRTLIIALLALATVPADASIRWPWHQGKVATVATSIPSAESDAVQPGAEISDDPLVQGLATIFSSEDITASLRINSIRGDREMVQCTSFLIQPTTRQRVTELLNVKATLQLAPIKPVGPLSLFAEKRRLQQDFLSGALTTRIAEQRGKLNELMRDANLACAPLFADEKLIGLRIVAAFGPKKVLP